MIRMKRHSRMLLSLGLSFGRPAADSDLAKLQTQVSAAKDA